MTQACAFQWSVSVTAWSVTSLHALKKVKGRVCKGLFELLMITTHEEVGPCVHAKDKIR